MTPSRIVFFLILGIFTSHLMVSIPHLPERFTVPTTGDGSEELYMSLTAFFSLNALILLSSLSLALAPLAFARILSVPLPGFKSNADLSEDSKTEIAKNCAALATVVVGLAAGANEILIRSSVTDKAFHPLTLPSVGLALLIFIAVWLTKMRSDLRIKK